mgnify:FL=1
MITLERPAYYVNDRYAEYCGLSTDDKSAINAKNADKFYELDTGDIYRYNEASSEWIKQPAQTTAVDTGIPPMTSETAGHFLSNDGNVTHWQAVASKNFVVRLTANADSTYVADKTFVEIKTAYDESRNIVVRYDDSQMPLMSVQFANDGNAVFLFGHVEVQTGGQRVVSRAIQYNHANTSDIWSDLDVETDMSEYLRLTGGTMLGDLSLSNDPTSNSHAATKQYVDKHNLEVQFAQDAVAGITTTTPIRDITQAVINNRTVTATLDGDVYVLASASAADASFVHIDGNRVTVLRYAVDGNAWAKEQTTLLETKGGTMTGNLNMGANAITNVQKIHVDGAAPIYIGSTIESGATNAARLTGVAGGGAAFVKANTQGEYATVAVGTPTQDNHAINMGYLLGEAVADQPTQNHQIANKEYVDACTSKCVQAVASPNGVLKAYLQNGNKQDVCVVSNDGSASSIARYTAAGHIIDNKVPTENNHLTNKQYVDTKVAQTGGNISGNLMVGGSLTVNGVGSVLGTPTQDVDIVNKGYVDAALTDVVRKSSVAVGANSSVNVSLSNGAYLLTVSDDMHGGLVFVSVYPSGETINGIVDVNNWKCDRISSGHGVILTNSANSEMTVYITSIGEGTYR